MNKRPTQADVARLASVSTATVSYVVNAQSGGRIPISPDTRDRVLAAIAELDYQPDARARSLRSGGTKTIGLLIPDMRNPFYWEIVDAVEKEVRGAGYEMLLACTSMDPKREIETLNALSGRRIDALILIISFLDQARELLRRLAEQGYSVVTFDFVIDELDRVETGFADATPKLMAHLFELGHRRMGFVHGVGSPDLATNRLRIFREFHHLHGLPLDEDLIIHCGESMEDGYRATSRLLTMSPRPTAIVTVNDLLAIGAQRAMYEHNLRIPEDVSLAGFDDVAMAAYLNPPLTTVRVSGRALGRKAAILALTRLQQADLPLRIEPVEAELIIRASTGPVANQTAQR